MRYFIFFLTAFFTTTQAQAVSTALANPLFVYEGVLTDLSDAPIHTLVTVRFIIQSGSCVLYKERKDITPNASGEFSHAVGSGTREDSTGNDAIKIFSSNATNVGCEGASAITLSGFSPKQLYIEVAGNLLSGSVNLNAVPLAINSQSLEGKKAAEFLQTASGANLTQSNLQNLFDGGNYTKLTTLITNVDSYVKTTANGTVSVPSLSSVSTPANGNMWYDTSTNQFKYYENGSTKTLSSGSGSVTSITPGTGLKNGTGTTAITATGTLNVDVGTGANQIVQMTSTSKLPAVDGSALINLNAANLSGEIGGSTSINTTGNITTTGSSTITTPTINATSATARSLKIYPASGNFYMELKTPTFSSNQIWTFPTSAGSSGNLLKTDGAGNLSWVAAGLSSSLSAGQVYVGNGSGQATAASISGDISISTSNLGEVTLSKIRGTTFSSTSPLSGQFIKYSSSTYAPGYVTIADIRSSVNSSAVFPTTACSSSKTLIWNSATDQFDCTNISVDASNFSAKTAKAFLAGPTSGVDAVPTFRTIASTDLPAGLYSTGTVGINTATAPRAALDVNGSIVNTAPSATSTSTIDFSKGNLQYTDNSCGSFDLTNVLNGGSYSFVVKGSTAATCSFNIYSGASGTGSYAGKIHFTPDNASTVAGKHTMYTIMAIGGDVYISWISGL